MRGRNLQHKPNIPSKQIGAFRSMLNYLGDWLHGDNPENELLDYVADSIEPKLKRVRGYRKKLQQPLQICLEHCNAIVAEIPGPIYLKRSHYSDDPLISAAFTGTERIEDLLDQEDRTASQPALSGTERVALLTMTSREQTVFGRKQQGNMIIGDSAMRAITFTDHNLVGLATTLAESREALQKYCLEIIVEATGRELAEMRTKLVDLRQRRERLQAMHKMFGERTAVNMGCVFVPFDPEKQEKRNKIEQMLKETESEIAAASSKSGTPDNWLTIVEHILSRPEDLLSVQPVSLRLNWSNILTDDPEEKASTINFATFTLGEEMQREGVLIAYDHI